MDLKQGDLENIILNALWDLEEEAMPKIFVGDVQEKIKSIKKKWAYTTVKTVLDRLVDKDIAARHKEGKKYLYTSVVTRENAGRLAVEKALRQFFRGDLDELQHCLNHLKDLQPMAEKTAVSAVTRAYELESASFESDTQELDKNIQSGGATFPNRPTQLRSDQGISGDPGYANPRRVVSV